MIIVRIVQFVKIVQLVQLDYYGYIKFFGGFVGTWVGAFTKEFAARMDMSEKHISKLINGEVKLTPEMASSRSIICRWK